MASVIISGRHMVCDKVVSISQAWYMCTNETTLVQAFVAGQYMSSYWHLAIHRYGDSAQYKIHGNMK